MVRNGEEQTTPEPESTTVQQLPPADSGACFVTPCVDPNFQQMTVELFRGQFSPDMHNVFPLLVEARQGYGLDFKSCQTWILFGEDKAVPAGGVTFRIHEALTHGTLTRVVPVLEVLFIAVREKSRNRQLGSTMVRVLEQEALRIGVPLMYVEIGREQERARSFWCHNGMRRISQVQGMDKDVKETVQVPPEMSHFFDSRCLRFDDTQQWVKQITYESSVAQDGQYVPFVWNLW